MRHHLHWGQSTLNFGLNFDLLFPITFQNLIFAKFFWILNIHHLSSFGHYGCVRCVVHTSVEVGYEYLNLNQKPARITVCIISRYSIDLKPVIFSQHFRYLI